MRFKHVQNGGIVREQRGLLGLEEMVRPLHLRMAAPWPRSSPRKDELI
jgi:hypothetical protein